MASDFTHVFAVPGEKSIVDGVDPETGRSCVNGHTLEQVRERYPTAEIFAWEDWRAARAAEQDVPVEWIEVSEDRYMDMLEVLPPVNFTSRGFQVGEPWDHSFATGRPRFASFRKRGSAYEESSRPMTSEEFRRAVGA